MDLFYLKTALLVVSSLIVMFVSVAGATTYYGIKIYFLIKKENKRGKLPN